MVLSGDESRKQVSDMLEAGAMAYIRKGATGAEISARLSAAIAAKQTTSPAFRAPVPEPI